jgi:ABC-2 type transport system permease protein
MLSLTLPIARTTLTECVRQPVYFLLIVICAGLMVLTTAGAGFSMGYTESGEVSGDTKLLLDLGLATVFAVSVLLTAFVATSAVSREIENKTVLTVVSKPVPRATLIVGKWLGVTGAMLIATSTMLIFMLLAVRHGVLTAVSDPVDQPVIIFGLSALFLACALGVWGSFFYGWSFPAVASVALLPLMFVAYVLVLTQKKDWGWAVMHERFMPQVVLTAIGLLICVPVLTSIAVAFSSRLGQVMTIVVCFAIFVLGLLSSHLLGSRAISNEPIGQILIAEADRERMSTMTQPGDIWYITSEAGYSITPRAGDAFFFAASPNGVDMPVQFVPFVNPADGPTQRTLADERAMISPGVPPALVITKVEGRKLTVKTIGGSPLAVERTPRSGDYVFLTPTRINYAAVGAWGLVPNLQFFWLLDAVSQNVPIPLSYLVMLAAYAACQVAVFLSLAVILFQKRDVG